MGFFLVGGSAFFLLPSTDRPTWGGYGVGGGGWGEALCIRLRFSVVLFLFFFNGDKRTTKS